MSDIQFFSCSQLTMKLIWNCLLSNIHLLNVVNTVSKMHNLTDNISFIEMSLCIISPHDNDRSCVMLCECE